MIAQNAFLEHTIYNGNRYGTSKRTVEDQKEKRMVVVLDIEMDGVQQMRADTTIDARYVFIKPPKFETLETRLRGRGTEDEAAIKERLARARIELEYADKEGAYDEIIVNDDLEQVYKELEEFVFRPIS
jgi:guanylate kinase